MEIREEPVDHLEPVAGIYEDPRFRCSRRDAPEPTSRGIFQCPRGGRPDSDHAAPLRLRAANRCCRGAVDLILFGIDDVILHAGDLLDMPVLELLRAVGPPVHAIHGNADSAAIRTVLPARLELELAGVHIGMTHAPGPPAGRLNRLRAAFPGCQAVIFGHTHMPEHGEQDGVQIFNPGSPTERRRAPVHTMGVARIADGAIAFELLVV